MIWTHASHLLADQAGCVHMLSSLGSQGKQGRESTELALRKSASVPSAPITLITASHVVKPRVRVERTTPEHMYKKVNYRGHLCDNQPHSHILFTQMSPRSI